MFSMIEDLFKIDQQIEKVEQDLDHFDETIESLNENNIECRPLISGSMGTQPFFIERYGEQKLQNASIVDSCGLYLPSHPNLTDDEIKLMSDLILASNK